MTKRVLVGAAACWLSLYLLTYVYVLGTQDGDVARWYVGLGLLALVACVAAVAGVRPSATTSIALVLTAIATLAGLLSIGLLLLPAVLALTVALFRHPAVNRPPASPPDHRWRLRHSEQ
jgi:hypothetical protein